MKSFFYFLFFLFLNIYAFLGQKNDTVAFDLKHSKVLIVSESEVNDEWDFKEDLNAKEEKKEDVTSAIFNIGIPSLSNNIKPWEIGYNHRIPYEPTMSNVWGYTTYRKLFSTLNNHCTIYSGIGVQILNLGLGNNVVENNNTLEFSIDSSFNPNKNKLRSNYIQAPLLVSFQPFLKNKAGFKIQIGASFNYRIKSLLIIKEKQKNNWINTREKNDFHFSQYFFNGHFNVVFKRFGIFSQFSGNSIFSDNKNDYLFSAGIILNTFK